ncbi:hypothetical protein MSG28_004763 [Choristoneura fumiferana]|uniref:Uncharacterized protein n=1 Tax=Choristoneura fumiferana TaxID=7141 RepID=A0ACC0K7X3_CHOFU|nr:hypothetical protein MSG28_004763 [Choristoneura fumiferana]
MANLVLCRLFIIFMGVMNYIDLNKMIASSLQRDIGDDADGAYRGHREQKCFVKLLENDSNVVEFEVEIYLVLQSERRRPSPQLPTPDYVTIPTTLMSYHYCPLDASYLPNRQYNSPYKKQTVSLNRLPKLPTLLYCFTLHLSLDRHDDFQRSKDDSFRMNSDACPSNMPPCGGSNPTNEGVECVHNTTP